MDWTGMLFQGWPGLGRTAIVGALAYVGLVLFLRVSGKRTLSKLNAFDLVVTVALAERVGRLRHPDRPAMGGGVDLDPLAGLRPVGARRTGGAAARRRAAGSGDAAMRRERVTEGEMLSAVREAGARELSEAEVVLLEGDGALTAILKR